MSHASSIKASHAAIKAYHAALKTYADHHAAHEGGVTRHSCEAG